MEGKKAQQPKNNQNRCNHSKHVVNSFNQRGVPVRKASCHAQHGCRLRIRAELRLPDKGLESGLLRHMQVAPRSATLSREAKRPCGGAGLAQLGRKGNATKRIAGPLGFPSANSFGWGAGLAAPRWGSSCDLNVFEAMRHRVVRAGHSELQQYEGDRRRRSEETPGRLVIRAAVSNYLLEPPVAVFDLSRAGFCWSCTGSCCF